MGSGNTAQHNFDQDNAPGLSHIYALIKRRSQIRKFLGSTKLIAEEMLISAAGADTGGEAPDPVSAPDQLCAAVFLMQDSKNIELLVPQYGRRENTYVTI